jgi:hypothetical protein
MSSEEKLPVLKEALEEFTWWWGRPLMDCVFVIKVADEYILGMDFLRSHDASVYLGLRVL